MKRQHHIIYIPGIHDDRLKVQSFLVSLWRVYGVRGHCHEMPCFGPEPYEPKFKSLLERIDRYSSQGHRISLVGASAGASAAINAYVERRNAIGGLAYICGKINAPETVSKRTYSNNPAFETSMYKLQDSLKELTVEDKARMHSFYTPADQVVPYEATVIPGVAESKLPALRHGQTIIYSLSFGAAGLLRPLKASRQPK